MQPNSAVRTGGTVPAWSTVTDLWTENPRLVELYDVECAGRWDHDFYLALTAGLGAGCVLDIGCGTGVFCADVASSGRRAIGVDPAEPMIEIARGRPGGDRVEWIVGDAADAPPGEADLAVMMGHVAQYFVDDDHWLRTLQQIRRSLTGGGRMTFESRNPRIDWAGEWTKERSRSTLDHPGGGTFDTWVEVVDRSGSADSYTTAHEGHTVLPGGDHLVTRETLRFRAQTEIEASLDAAGFTIEQRWGDWERGPLTSTSREMIFLARRA